MTATTNGRPVPPLVHAAVPTILELDDSAVGSEPEAFPQHPAKEPKPVAELRAQLDVARALVELQDDEALQFARSPRERAADRKVTEKIRAVERRERRRAGVERVRDARRTRTDDRWSARARRARERLLNPNRRLAATYRRYIGLSAITGVLVVTGVAWMATTVHHGLVGVDGTWLAYLVEPLASALLVVSMVAQFTAIEHGEKNPKWFLCLDGGLAAASLVLNIVPWGLRFGWDAGEVLAHALPPLLIAAAVVVHHMLNRLFGSIFAALHVELEETLRLSEETADILVLVERTKQAIAAGHLELNESGLPSKEAIRKKFGIGKQRAQLTGDALELIQRTF